MNVDEFISRRSEDGQKESEGSFSVDSVSALRKTLSSALPEPHFYLFQLIQGLILGGATDLKVAIGRRENRVSFQDPQRRFADLEGLAATFNERLSVATNTPYDLVMSGMTTALGDHMDRAEFLYDQQRVQVTSANGVEHSTQSRSHSPCIVLRRAMGTGLSFSWSRIWGARKEEFRVRKRFEHSPRPLSIAGLPTEPRSSWRRGVEEGHFALVEIAILGQPNHRGEPLGQTEAIANSGWLRKCGSVPKKTEGSELAIAPNLFAAALRDGKPVSADDLEASWDLREWTICFTSHTDTPSQVLFVRNGCNLESVEVEVGPTGIQIVAPADDLQVDASGYGVVQNSAFETRVKEAAGLVQSIISLLREEDLSSALAASGDDPEAILGRFDWLTEE